MNESSSLYDPRTAPEDAGQDERLIDRFPVRLRRARALAR